MMCNQNSRDSVVPLAYVNRTLNISIYGDGSVFGGIARCSWRYWEKLRTEYVQIS
jgi:hypothetical protein